MIENKEEIKELLDVETKVSSLKDVEIKSFTKYPNWIKIVCKWNYFDILFTLYNYEKKKDCHTFSASYKYGGKKWIELDYADIYAKKDLTNRIRFAIACLQIERNAMGSESLLGPFVFWR